MVLPGVKHRRAGSQPRVTRLTPVSHLTHCELHTSMKVQGSRFHAPGPLLTVQTAATGDRSSTREVSCWSETVLHFNSVQPHRPQPLCEIVSLLSKLRNDRNTSASLMLSRQACPLVCVFSALACIWFPYWCVCCAGDPEAGGALKQSQHSRQEMTRWLTSQRTAGEETQHTVDGVEQSQYPVSVCQAV